MAGWFKAVQKPVKPTRLKGSARKVAGIKAAQGANRRSTVANLPAGKLPPFSEP
jgi:hypothetical protein